MKTGILLEKLINISQTSKTDFAIHMNMTPSGLSKILAGSRLPLAKEKKIFYNRAAHYFAEALYSYGCYLKLKDIFPIIYDFHTSHELKEFLTYAIKYAMDNDFAAENSVDMKYPDRAESYIGYKMILNMMCIMVSDHIICDGTNTLEFYASLPLINRSYTDIFQRIKILCTRDETNITVNHFWDKTSYETAYSDFYPDLLSLLTDAEHRVDLVFWQTESGGRQLFAAEREIPFEF